MMVEERLLPCFLGEGLVVRSLREKSAKLFAEASEKTSVISSDSYGSIDVSSSVSI